MAYFADSALVALESLMNSIPFKTPIFSILCSKPLKLFIAFIFDVVVKFILFVVAKV